MFMTLCSILKNILARRGRAVLNFRIINLSQTKLVIRCRTINNGCIRFLPHRTLFTTAACLESGESEIRESGTASSQKGSHTKSDSGTGFEESICDVYNSFPGKTLKTNMEAETATTVAVAAESLNSDSELVSKFDGLDLEFDICENEIEEKGRSVERFNNKDKDEESKRINKENLELWDELMNKTGRKKADFPHFKILRNRPLTDATAVFHHNAWDNIEWDEEMQTKAEEAVSKNSQTVMLDEKKTMLEEEADEHWDKFYQIHQNKFFKDRNWLFDEFPELIKGEHGCSVSQDEFLTGLEEKRVNESFPGENSGFRVLEVGCGAGNTVFPLLNGINNPEVYLYCCDFSKNAVDIVKNHEKFQANRCTSFVLDITEENPVTPFPLGSLDVITCIFVLSAISPEKFEQVVRNLHGFLKPGGLILFRDYGRYDLAQLRFKDGRCISENFYMRGDGTRVYFFTPDEVENLFITRGFTKTALYVDRRLQVNRSKQLKMYRVWVLAKFSKQAL